MSYFKQALYNEGSKSTIYISTKSHCSDPDVINTIIRIFKEDKHGNRVCSHVINVDEIDDIINELQKCKKNMMDYLQGKPISMSKDDILADNQFSKFSDDFIVRSKKKWWQL